MCIIGACDGMYTPPVVRDLVRRSIRRLYPHQCPDFRTAVGWNDLPEVTHEQVLAVLDDAILQL